MKTILLTLFITSLSVLAFSQTGNLVPLWPGEVPGETGEKKPPVKEPSRNDNVLRFQEVTDPVLELFLPVGDNKKNPAVVVCPGGAYQILAYDKEGTEIAAWLNENGIAAFVLKYRVPDKKEGALQDIQRALRIVRNGSEEWNIDPERTGVIGFSAGGSLSARASTLFNRDTYSPVDEKDSLSCRPSFAMLIYPAYLDQGPDNTITSELDLTGDIPPLFIFQTADDPYGNSAFVMGKALRESGLPVELHIVPEGGHGYGLRKGNRAAEIWPKLAERWLTGILQE